MKLSYGIENLRTIEEMEPVELRPITILVGANSSGKSTYLRSVSLMRQSLEESMEEPILWYKEGSIDFGDFDTAVRNNETNREIKFRFKFQGVPLDNFDWNHMQNFRSQSPQGKIMNDVRYDLGIMKKNGKTILSSIEINVVEHNLSFKVDFTNKKFELNKNNIADKIKVDDKILKNYNIDSNVFKNYIENNVVYANKFSPYNENEIFAYENIFNLMSKISKIELKKDLLLDESGIVSFSFPFTEEIINKKIVETKNENIKNIYKKMLSKKNKKILDEIKLNCSLNLIFYLKSYMDDSLQKFFKNATRIGPARDLKERFYRIQGLDVSEIWVDGRNLPMYFYKLARNGELKEFSNWVNELIGYQIEIKERPPNVEICMVKDDSKVNLIDTGYGISQILPILSQIWLNTMGKKKKAGNRQQMELEEFLPILMEQPELHLHPIHQAQIADALVSSLKFNSENPEATKPIFIVETHSEALIIKLSALIREKKLSPEDVQVVVFSKATNKTNTTEVTVSTFDEEGRLGNWPHRFFNYRS